MASKTGILLTGSTGTVGSEVRRQLLEKKIPFRALVHTPEKVRRVEERGVEARVGDFDRPETLKRALEGMEKILLVTNSNLKQAEREIALADLAKEAGVRHIVKISVMGAALDSPVSFGRWHAQIEKHLEGTGLTYTHLRPNYFMQNFLQSVPSLRDSGLIYGSLGEARVSMIDAADIAAAAVRCLTRPGCENKTYELTGPEALSQREAAAAISRVLGRTVNYVNLPLEESRKAMLGSGIPAWYADALVDMTRAFLEGFGAKVTSAVADITGRPARSFGEFARHFEPLAALREKKAA